jgi:anthranilate synthase/aminodeoxychorismate synthase-like glutamine amidotransferase
MICFWSARTIRLPIFAFKDLSPEGSLVIILDNYDSFVFNLVQYLGVYRQDLKVLRSDLVSTEDVLAMKPSHVVISPGPCTPNEAGISMDLIRQAPLDLPILGVCLGHQAIAQALGAEVIRGEAPVHGKISRIHHDGSGVFADLPSPMEVTRYHSLVVKPESLPEDLEINARTVEGTVMGIRHRERPVWGVQFHPESLCTEHGLKMIQTFLSIQGK